jgi:ApbE superfamily uncharacterized protein (UPF0280 family)
MEGGEQLGRRLSFLDSAVIEEYGIHIKGLSEIVKNKTAHLHDYIRIRNPRIQQTYFFCKLSKHINIQRVIRYRSYHSVGTVVTVELSKKYP